MVTKITDPKQKQELHEEIKKRLKEARAKKKA